MAIDINSLIQELFPDVRKQYIGGSDGDPGEEQWTGGDRARGASGLENWGSMFDQMANAAANGQPGINISPERRAQILRQMAQASPTGTINYQQAGQFLTPEENQALNQWVDWSQQENSKLSFGDILARSAFAAGTGAIGGAAFGVGPIASASGTAGSGGVFGASAPWATGADAAWGVNPSGWNSEIGLDGAMADSAANYSAATGGSMSGWADILNGLKPADYLKAGTSVLSGVLGSRATDRAVDAQVGASREGIDEQRRQYDQTRADLMPFMRSGYSANARLARLLGIDDSQAGQSGYGDLTRRFTMADRDADPVYQSGLQFGLDEGRKGINARATATGNWDSGSTLKALTRYGNDYGSTKANDSFNRFNAENTNIYNRLAGVSGGGQTASNTVAGSGSATANNVAGLQTGIGNATAAGIVGGNNAWNTAIGGVVNGATQDAETRAILDRLLRR